MTDEEHAEAERQALQDMLDCSDNHDPVGASRAWQRFRELHASRSPEMVAEMERRMRIGGESNG